MNKFDWDHPVHLQPMCPTAVKQVSVTWDAYGATKGAHGICILIEWDEFKTLDYKKIYNSMQKPAFLFDGRNVVDLEKIREIGFIVYSIGKPLDPWLKDMRGLNVGNPKDLLLIVSLFEGSTIYIHITLYYGGSYRSQ
jgi:UDPglucose 6-dehydrogenase